jgi:hypothetical protein
MSATVLDIIIYIYQVYMNTDNTDMALGLIIRMACTLYLVCKYFLRVFPPNNGQFGEDIELKRHV